MRNVDRWPHGFTIVGEARVPRRVDDVFSFIQSRIPEVYKKMAAGHDHFVVRGGGPLIPDAVVDCAERAGNQRVVHVYRVHTVEPGARIAYRSEPTYAYVRSGRKEIVFKSVSHVAYDFEADPGGGCRFRLSITIQLKNSLIVLMNRLIGGFRPWQKHCAEEVASLATILVEELAPAT
jgi:hypothetical protein